MKLLKKEITSLVSYQTNGKSFVWFNSYKNFSSFHNKTLLFKTNGLQKSYFNKFVIRDFSQKLVINFPKGAESVTEGELKEFPKGVGEFVKQNEIICSISTEKTELEIRAPQSGKISKIYHKVQANIKVDEPLFEIEVMDIPKEVSSKALAPELKSEPQPQLKNEVKSEVKQELKEVKSETKTSTKIIDSFDIGSTRSIEANAISRIRNIINEKLKLVQSEKAVLSTFNEVNFLY